MKATWTPEMVKALGVRTTVPVAGEIIAGWHRDDAYDAVKRGEFPVPVIKAGRRYVVPVAPILALLGIGPPDTAEADPAPPEPASPADVTPTTTRSTATHDDSAGYRRPPARRGRGAA